MLVLSCPTARSVGRWRRAPGPRTLDLWLRRTRVCVYVGAWNDACSVHPPRHGATQRRMSEWGARVRARSRWLCPPARWNSVDFGALVRCGRRLFARHLPARGWNAHHHPGGPGPWDASRHRGTVTFTFRRGARSYVRFAGRSEG